MASTTPWVWSGGINRAQDVTIQEGRQVTRNNWSLTRKRTSDDTYISELGDSAASLEAYNGGVTEAVIPPPTEVVMFDTATAWTNTTTKWVPSGTINNGVPIYVSDEDPNIPDLSKINILYLGYNSSTSKWFWSAYESVDGLPGPSINRCNSAESTAKPDIDGLFFGTNSGTFTGDATASIVEEDIYEFYCSGDNQTYPQKSVDWYTQIQTWIFKDGFQ